MEGDDIQFAFRFLEKMCDGSGDKGIAEAMKPVFLETVLLGDHDIDCVRPDGLGDRSVKSSVKVGNVLCGR
jgi:hypothetical protein